MDTCDVCETNNIRYRLKNTDIITCQHCDEVKYTMLELNICSTECPNLYWDPVEYLSKKGDKTVEVSYLLEKDECGNCGQRDFQVILFKGTFVG